MHGALRIGWPGAAAKVGTAAKVLTGNKVCPAAKVLTGKKVGPAAKVLTGNELHVCIGWPGAAAEVQRTPPWCAAGDAAAGAASAATADHRAGAAELSSVCWCVFSCIGGSSTRVLKETTAGAGAALTVGAGAAVVMATALAEDCMLAEPGGTMTSAS